MRIEFKKNPKVNDDVEDVIIIGKLIEAIKLAIWLFISLIRKKVTIKKYFPDCLTLYCMGFNLLKNIVSNFDKIIKRFIETWISK